MTNPLSNPIPMKKKLAIIIFAALTGTAAYGFYLYNKPVASLADQKALYTVSATRLMREYQENEAASNSRYLGKILKVKGKISDIVTDEKGTLTIHLETDDAFVVSCQLADDQKKNIASLSKNAEVMLKGVCTGILMDVVLVDCVRSN